MINKNINAKIIHYYKLYFKFTEIAQICGVSRQFVSRTIKQTYTIEQIEKHNQEKTTALREFARQELKNKYHNDEKYRELIKAKARIYEKRKRARNQAKRSSKH